MWMRLGLAMALSIGCASLAAAENIQRDVAAGKPIALMPILNFERSACAAYPVHNIRIAKPPAHGAVQLIVQAVSMDAIVPHCKGKKVKPTFVVYRSNPGYRGQDSVSVTFTRPTNTGEMTEAYMSFDIAITVK